MKPHIRIQIEDFDVNDELHALTAESGETGAIVSFLGLVRGEGGLTAMELEHYPGMTEQEIERHCSEAAARWPLLGVSILHRVGRLAPGARIVLVAVAGRHRGDAFSACEFLMDYLKTRAPFWKREERAGEIQWVEARASDHEAARRWQ